MSISMGSGENGFSLTLGILMEESEGWGSGPSSNSIQRD